MSLPLLALPLALLTAPAAATDDPLFAPTREREERDEPLQASVRSAGSFGIGVGGGTTTAGLSAKYWASEVLAVQGVVGAGYRDVRRSTLGDDGWDAGLGLSADLLFELPSFAALDDVEFGLGLGPGVGLQVSESGVAMAMAGVVGLEACLLVFPLDLVVEYRPSVMIFPTNQVDGFNLSGHLRYYFKTRRR